MEKPISQVFDKSEIPADMEGVLICSAKVDSENRILRASFKFPNIVPFDVWAGFKKTVIKNYKLSQFKTKIEFGQVDITPDFIAVFKDYLISVVSEDSPMFAYIFEGSNWEIEENRILVTIKHGSGEILEEKKSANIMEKAIFSATGAQMEVVFDDKPEAPPMPDLSKVTAPVKKEQAPAAAAPESDILLGKKITGEPMPMSEITENTGLCTIEGEVFSVNDREMPQGKYLVLFSITDYTGSVTCKMFLTAEKYAQVKDKLKKKLYCTVFGDAAFDKYEQELTISVKSINLAKKETKSDNAPKKRVELHLHTKMSAMDGVTSTKDYIARAAQYGHTAIAVTDHGCVYAFPEAFKAKKDDMKIIYGIEAYFVNDCDNLIYSGSNQSLDDEIVIFDTETTGISAKNGGLTEIGAVVVKGGEITERFSTFVNPGVHIPEKITEITGIDDSMVADAPAPAEAVSAFIEFCAGRPVAAHNAVFDMGFIRETVIQAGLTFSPGCLDTLPLCRALLPDQKKHGLEAMSKFFNVPNPSHHRAVNDAEVLAGIWIGCIPLLREKGVENLGDINIKLATAGSYKSKPSYHAVILVKNQQGLRNLYELISLSNLKYFHKTPRMPKSEILKRREGLIISPGCEAGELFRAIVSGAEQSVIDDICEFYDYFEIQPIGNNRFMIDAGSARDEEQLRDYNREIVRLGEKHGKPVCATGDVHFLDPHDEVFRRIIMASKGFKDADDQAPLYYRTTDEMLEEFGYLGDEKAREVVIENTNLIADMIEEVRPTPKGMFAPEIEGAVEDIENMSRTRAAEIYGTPLPSIVETRMNRELKSIIGNGFAVMYIIAQKLVKKSNDDGYMVGSRGSVGSSFVAFLTNITEVNPLPPHYVCKKCKYSEFIEDGSVGSGTDMQDKICPQCGEKLYKDGHDIPFETFLGFDGDKAPDIDLNFSGDYQAVAHKYTEELFGEGHTFRAGTIAGVAEKTAFGYVRSYFEERGGMPGKAETERLTLGCTEVRRTTGQHPGGIIVVPKNNDIHEFTPVQHPADKSGVDVITTHFEYHSIDQNLLKLDILGHDDPTVIRMLEDLTGVNAREIPLDDKKTMSLFLNIEALDVKSGDIRSKVGTYGVPEFGTKFVRQMLLDTKPTTMSELIRISGLSHGTDVWLGNAQELIRSGKCNLSGCICTRDDIMLYLIYKGVEAKLAFTIMESVRKGKGLKPEWEEAMRANDVPEWYIGSCKKIKYMFPKAHAAAYVTMAFRIAWFKVYYPLEFYMAYFTVRADDFDYEIMAKGQRLAEKKILEFEGKGNSASQKEKNTLLILELCNEMYCRGFEFCPIDIYKSDAVKFKNLDGKILPPLNSIPGLGVNAAKSIVAAREDGEFLSKEDLYARTGATKTVIETLERNGCLEGMPDSSQVTMF
ncbi:MAG: PolC-type DNA polymerase III [Clostridia bacterium]|nr:PolC-type DNA polymerase III [Clostridia bacterium]